jgi:hypothetical protein
MRARQMLILVVLAAALTAWWYLDLGRYLRFETLTSGIDELRAWRAAQPAVAAAAYFAAYVAVTGLSLPGAAIMTLAGGALFGFWWALLLVSFASSAGATLAFLVSRLLLRDWVQSRFGTQLKRFNDGFARDGAFYLSQPAPRTRVPILCHQPDRRAAADFRGALLLGIATRHAAGDRGLRECGYAARPARRDPRASSRRRSSRRCCCALAVFPYLARAILRRRAAVAACAACAGPASSIRTWW